MNTILRYELRKLFVKRSTLVCAIVLVLLAIVAVWSNVIGEYWYDGQKELKGLDAITAARETIHKNGGSMDVTKLNEALTSYHKAYGDPANFQEYEGGERGLSNEAFHTYLQPYNEILHLVRLAYSPKEYTYEITVKDATDFYERRFTGMEMDRERKLHLLSNQEERDYFHKMDQQIPTPYHLDYSKGWEVLFNGLGFYTLILTFLVCVRLSPVFAQEVQTGAASILLSSRFGRNKLLTAKLQAGFIFTTAMYLGGVAIITLLVLAVYGTNGWDSSLQILKFGSPYPYTLLETYGWTVAMGYLGCLLMMGVTLALSARLRSSFSVIVGVVVLLIGGLFIHASDTLRWWNKLLPFLPSSLMDGYGIVTGLELYPWFTGLIPVAAVTASYAIVIVVMSMPYAYRSFRRVQVH